MSEKKPTSGKGESKMNTLEYGVMEGKYVIVGYESNDLDEEINTILIYKIVNGVAQTIFGILDFPPYQSVEDPSLTNLILEKIKDLNITEVYELFNLQDDNLQFIDKTNYFGISFGSEDDQEVNKKGEVVGWWQASPYIASSDVLDALIENGVQIKTYDVKNKKVIE